MPGAWKKARPQEGVNLAPRRPRLVAALADVPPRTAMELRRLVCIPSSRFAATLAT
jgi:hypothetical protein